MSLERAKAYLKEYKMEDQIREFPVSSATVELAAEALHTEAGRIAKTLSFLVDGEAVLIVCAGDARKMCIRDRGDGDLFSPGREKSGRCLCDSHRSGKKDRRIRKDALDGRWNRHSD